MQSWLQFLCRVRACRRFQKFGGRWSPTPLNLMGMSDPVGIQSPLCVTARNLSLYAKPRGSVSRITKTFGTSGPRFSRLSRSFKVIGTDTDRSAIYDFLLVISSYCTVSEINGKIEKCLHTNVFNALPLGFHSSLEIL